MGSPLLLLLPTLLLHLQKPLAMLQVVPLWLLRLLARRPLLLRLEALYLPPLPLQEPPRWPLEVVQMSLQQRERRLRSSRWRLHRRRPWVLHCGQWEG